MATYAINNLSFSSSTYTLNFETTKPSCYQFLGNSLFQKPANFGPCKSHIQPILASINVEEIGQVKTKEEKPRFKWVEIGPHITETQKQAISELPPKMTKRCKALMKQLICFSHQKASVSDLLGAWVRIMKPRRTDWLSVLKELKNTEHPLYLEVHFFILKFKSLVDFLRVILLVYFSFLCSLKFWLQTVWACLVVAIMHAVCIVL